MAQFESSGRMIQGASLKLTAIVAALTVLALTTFTLLPPSSAPTHRPSNFGTWFYGRLQYIGSRTGRPSLVRFCAPRLHAAYMRALSRSVDRGQVEIVHYTMVADREESQAVTDSLVKQANESGVDFLMVDGGSAPDVALYVWSRDASKMRRIISSLAGARKKSTDLQK